MNHTKEVVGEDLVQGSVHTFRRALWAEHTGQHSEEHIDPSKVRSVLRGMRGECCVEC